MMNVQLNFNGDFVKASHVRIVIGKIEFLIHTEYDSAESETGRIEILKTDNSLAPITITPVVGNKVILA